MNMSTGELSACHFHHEDVIQVKNIEGNLIINIPYSNIPTNRHPLSSPPTLMASQAKTLDLTCLLIIPISLATTPMNPRILKRTSTTSYPSDHLVLIITSPFVAHVSLKDAPSKSTLAFNFLGTIISNLVSSPMGLANRLQTQ